MSAEQRLDARGRMWVWIWGYVLATAPVMGLFWQLSRVSEWPLIICFAPAVLLGRHVGASDALHGTYYLMPVQCLIYGLIMARAEVTNRRAGIALGLAIAHAVIALRAASVTGGHL